MITSIHLMTKTFHPKTAVTSRTMLFVYHLLNACKMHQHSYISEIYSSYDGFWIVCYEACINYGKNVERIIFVKILGRCWFRLLKCITPVAHSLYRVKFISNFEISIKTTCFDTYSDIQLFLNTLAIYPTFERQNAILQNPMFLNH